MKFTDRQLSRSFFVVAVVLSLGLVAKWFYQQERLFAISDHGHRISDSGTFFHEQFISFSKTATTHASSITRRADGKLIAVWFSGSEEGARDVVMAGTIIDPLSRTISPSRILATVSDTEVATWRYIRKLGNPIIHSLPDGRLMMVYVSVSFGGWAASSLNIRFSGDLGQTWTPPRKLVTTPSLNISTLVRGVPIDFDNGDIGLPVYHEFLGKFAELLILDREGIVRDKRRISWGRATIQPAITPLSPRNAVTLLRDSGELDKRIKISRSDNSGQSWSAPSPISLPNPNSSVALHRIDGRRLIAVFNNHEDERHDLSMAYSPDAGKTWKVFHRLEYEPIAKKGLKNKFSYPSLIRDQQGDFHLTYTWRKKRIKYVHFNLAWLEQKI